MVRVLTPERATFAQWVGFAILAIFFGWVLANASLPALMDIPL